MTGPMESLESGEAVDVAFMREALAQAALAEAAGEVPIGAVVVADGVVIGRGFNRPIGSKDPTAHAEILALREAAQVVGNYRLTGVRVYVTVEPCLMCVGAIVHARVGTLIYGVSEPKAGAVSSAIPVLNHAALNHRVEVIQGVLADECRDVLQRFFQAALILMVITLIITVGIEVPIDNQIKTWTPETLPSHWTELRSTWDRFHTLRTITSILSFVSLSVGVILNTGHRHTE